MERRAGRVPVKRGKFIAFEGGEGIGKSTQAKLLHEALAADGLDVILTREPGGTPGAEAIRSLLLDPPGDGWGARAEALLFAAARSDHVERLIQPSLAQGRWVISDRFVDSSRAYQGGAGRLGDDVIMTLHTFGSQSLLPDLTVLISVPSAETEQRLRNRDGLSSDAIGGRSAKYHDGVGAAFQSMADAEPHRFVVVNGTGTVDEVQARVWQVVEPFVHADPA